MPNMVWSQRLQSRDHESCHAMTATFLFRVKTLSHLSETPNKNDQVNTSRRVYWTCQSHMCNCGAESISFSRKLLAADGDFLRGAWVVATRLTSQNAVSKKTSDPTSCPTGNYEPPSMSERGCPLQSLVRLALAAGSTQLHRGSNGGFLKWEVFSAGFP